MNRVTNTMPGYSRRSLTEKLGIPPGQRLVVRHEPRPYPLLVGRLPSGSSLTSRLFRNSGFIHQFATRTSDLRADFPRLAQALADDGMLWVSWPKRSSGVVTDLNENIVRELGLAQGLVDVKVCAVDEVWSGLKFVRRLVNRKPQ
jgi:hypothetical protein